LIGGHTRSHGINDDDDDNGDENGDNVSKRQQQPKPKQPNDGYSE